MISCPSCGTRYPSGTETCPKDGTRLPSGVMLAPSLVDEPGHGSPRRETPPDSPWVDSPTETRESLAGVKLGDYKVIEKLGEGGMGIVYRGVQPLIGKPVAIKVMRTEFAANPRQVERLIEEARAVNAIRHPGIVDIFNIGSTPDGRQYVVMELLEGRALDEVLKQQGRLKPFEALPILEQALAALDAAHSAGVIHRDLKPSNIFLVDLADHTHLVKLLDFGLAKRGAVGGKTSQTSTNLVVGTPAYMAPEQARGHQVSHRTDLYAMGIVAYELLTGKMPFDGASAVETMMMQLDAAPRPPSELEPEIPASVEALILKMLAKEPEQRPGSAAEVRRELVRIRKELTSAQTVIAQLRTGEGGSVTLVERRSPTTDVKATPVDSAAIGGTMAATVLDDDPLRVDPALAARFNALINAAPEEPPEPQSPAEPSTPEARTHREITPVRVPTPRRWPWAAAGIVLALAAVAAIVIWLPRPRPGDPLLVAPPPPPLTNPMVVAPTPVEAKPEEPVKPVVLPPETPLPTARPVALKSQPNVSAPRPRLPRGHSKEEVHARLESLRARNDKAPEGQSHRLNLLMLESADRALASGNLVEAWNALDVVDEKLR